MNAVILYRSKYGATREAAGRIAEQIGPAARSEEITSKLVLPEEEVVIVGAPIYAGSVPGVVTKFLDAHRERILARRLYLYLSCLYKDTRAEQQLADAFPAWAVAHSSGNYYVGGRVIVSQLGFLDRLIMKRVAGVTEDVRQLRPEEMDRLAGDVRQAMGA